MRFFRKAKKKDGWLTFAFQGEGVAAAAVSRRGADKPVVNVCSFFPEIANAEAFEKAGKELQANAYQLSTLLSGKEYQLLSVEAPNVPPEELRTAIRWRLKDMLDYHLDDATIDVLDVPVEANAPNRSHSMFAVAARNSVIKQKQEFFGDAKIDLQVIDIPEMAQRNIAGLLELEGRGLAMLSFGSEGGLLTVTYKGELYLSRRIDVVASQLNEQDFEKKQALFDRITLELQRSLDHFDRQFNYISVNKLLLAPLESTGLDAYLASNLYTPVESFDLGEVFDLSAVPSLQERNAQQQYFLALGAALRLEETSL
jgi:MSHA biogenesis protein MshI